MKDNRNEDNNIVITDVKLKKSIHYVLNKHFESIQESLVNARKEIIDNYTKSNNEYKISLEKIKTLYETEINDLISIFVNSKLSEKINSISLFTNEVTNFVYDIQNSHDGAKLQANENHLLYTTWKDEVSLYPSMENLTEYIFTKTNDLLNEKKEEKIIQKKKNTEEKFYFDYKNELEKIFKTEDINNDIKDLNYAIDSHVVNIIDCVTKSVFVDSRFFDKYNSLLNEYKELSPSLLETFELNLIENKIENPRVIFGNLDRKCYQFDSISKAKLACINSPLFIGEGTFNDFIKKVNVLDNSSIEKINKELEAGYKVTNNTNLIKATEMINKEYLLKAVSEKKQHNLVDKENAKIIDNFKDKMKELGQKKKSEGKQYKNMELFKELIVTFESKEVKTILNYLTPLGCKDEKSAEMILGRLIENRPRKKDVKNEINYER